MTDRIPLIVDATANQIQELPTGDVLQLNNGNHLDIGTNGDLRFCRPYETGHVSMSGAAGIVSKVLLNITAPDDTQVIIRKNGETNGNVLASFDMDGGCQFFWQGSTTNNEHAGSPTNKRIETNIDGTRIYGELELTGKLKCTSTTEPFYPPVVTTTERDAITGMTKGAMVFNSITNKLNVYSGSGWEAVTSS